MLDRKIQKHNIHHATHQLGNHRKDRIWTEVFYGLKNLVMLPKSPCLCWEFQRRDGCSDSLQGAIVAFTKGLAQELTQKKGIRVNTVAPGPIWTPLIVESFPPERVRFIPLWYL